MLKDNIMKLMGETDTKYRAGEELSGSSTHVPRRTLMSSPCPLLALTVCESTSKIRPRRTTRSGFSKNFVQEQILIFSCFRSADLKHFSSHKSDDLFDSHAPFLMERGTLRAPIPCFSGHRDSNSGK